jgi:hypothetical protein
MRNGWISWKSGNKSVHFEEKENKQMSEALNPLYLEKLLHSMRLLTKPPRYIAAHRVSGWRSTGETEWEEPEAVHGHGGHRPKRGKVEHIREVPEEYAADFRRIAEERKRLQLQLAYLSTQERELMEVAYPVSRPLTVSEIKNNQEKK